MARRKLNARGRRQIKSSNYVYPSAKKYPIHDVRHAKAALRMAGRRDTYGSAATVRRAVFRKYPSLKPSGSSGSKRKRSRKRRGRSRR